ncbi:MULTISPECIES: class I SAM-dependent methyltransferase [Streptomyces]|uniref:SAM-dependent methyltransferase n=1 Tax=Streptomyces tirandamycinicus TaxID=2174846 RepID=A0A2S1T0Q3_9ACTN|nr:MULTISPECIES: class I SAM-dependent methyltransferase [Streptomyces]AWI32196.1 SAM-dependent methyltransferase [Streptomyces tirandamycinicus]NNJ05101.1 class I SAM-dependent methyltransferase [Streptomyces sp. PKU-MA01144]
MTVADGQRAGETMYGTDLARVYDLVHRGRGKDYRAETEAVAAAARRHRPGAARLLDIACGTGGHLRHFADLFGHVEGLELSAPMAEAARRALPGVSVHPGDMRDFRLGTTFDVVTCMFGSIGYTASVAELRRALAVFARHLEPGGVAVVDPWWFPETFADGHVSADVVTVEGVTVSRLSHSARRGRASHMDVHFVVAEPGAGARHFVDTHIISLFSRSEYEEAFREAGFTVEYLPEAPSGRGLFVGVRAGDGHGKPASDDERGTA